MGTLIGLTFNDAEDAGSGKEESGKDAGSGKEDGKEGGGPAESDDTKKTKAG